MCCKIHKNPEVLWMRLHDRQQLYVILSEPCKWHSWTQMTAVHSNGDSAVWLGLTRYPVQGIMKMTIWNKQCTPVSSTSYRTNTWYVVPDTRHGPGGWSTTWLRDWLLSANTSGLRSSGNMQLVFIGKLWTASNSNPSATFTVIIL